MPQAVASARSESAFALASVQGTVSQFSNEEAVVYAGDLIRSDATRVTLETPQAERIVIGPASEISLGESTPRTLHLNRGETVVRVPEGRSIELIAGNYRVQASATADTASRFFVKLRDSGDQIFVFPYTLPVTVSGGLENQQELVMPERGAVIGTTGSGALRVVLLQQGDSETETKRPLLKTVYRTYDPAYAVDTNGDPIDPSSLGWESQMGLLQSRPETDSQPLRLEIPVRGLSKDREVEGASDQPEESNEGTGWIGPHFVRAHVRTSPEFAGTTDPTFATPAMLAFKVRWESNDDYDSYYFDPNDKNANYEQDQPNTDYYDPNQDIPNNEMLDLGTVDLTDGIADLYIDDAPAPFWASIQGLDFTPVGIWWVAGAEPVDDAVGAGVVGEEAAVAGGDTDFAGWILPIGGGALLAGGLGWGVYELTDDDDDDDDDDDPRRPFSPVAPRNGGSLNPVPTPVPTPDTI